jgi:hypothetical protein
LDLISAASISGRVTDAGGRPASRQRIYLAAPVGRGRYYPSINTVTGGPAIVNPEQERIQNVWWSLGDIFTDEHGSYTARGLSPGRYLVSVGEDIARISGNAVDSHDDYGNMGTVESDQYYLMTFYPEVASASEATVIELAAGSQVQGIDIRVGTKLSARRIIGHTIDGETGKPVGNCEIYLSHLGTEGPIRTWNPESIHSDLRGAFSINRLISGEFIVGASLGDSSDQYGEPAHLTIGDEDINGLEVRLEHGHAMSGVLVPDGEVTPEVIQKLGRLQLSARAFSPGQLVSRRTSVTPDGSFRLLGLPPGQISLDLANATGDLSFLLLRVEHAAASAFRGIEMGAEDLTGVRLVVRYASGTIRGKVNLVGGKIPADKELVADYACAANGESQVSSRTVSPDGTFELNDVPSGECQVTLVYGPFKKRASIDKVVTVRPFTTAEVSFDLDLNLLLKQ